MMARNSAVVCSGVHGSASRALSASSVEVEAGACGGFVDEGVAGVDVLGMEACDEGERRARLRGGITIRIPRL